jgi:hypothetical protein
MKDHLSPVMEGFENPTMKTIFGELLQVTPNTRTSNSGKISFLKSILLQQKTTADSLMQSAKKINTVSQKIINSRNAYEAAFESDKIAPLPKMSGTLQGFTFVFFVISFISLGIIMSIAVNQYTGNTTYAVITMCVFIISIIVSVPVIVRFG